MAQGLVDTQQRLIGILYRFDCPSPLTIGEHVMDLLVEPVRTEFARHLVECRLCEAELKTARAFLASV
jgi:hypothetical protein